MEQILWFMLGVIFGGTLVGQYITRHWEKRHNNCPYNQTQTKCKDSSYTVSGKSIKINDKITVDGEVIDKNIKHHHVFITVTGDCHDLTTTNGNVDVKGNITNNVHTTNGDVTVHNNVNGNITTTTGDVVCNGAVGGNVQTELGNIKL